MRSRATHRSILRLGLPQVTTYAGSCMSGFVKNENGTGNSQQSIRCSTHIDITMAARCVVIFLAGQHVTRKGRAGIYRVARKGAWAPQWLLVTAHAPFGASSAYRPAIVANASACRSGLQPSI
jgi:hypothetical protein